MASFIENIDVNALSKSAKELFLATTDGAKKAYCKAKDDYEDLCPETRKAIIIGVSVFAIVLAVAGCFYLLGKRAGRKEQIEVEYEEWDA